MPSVRTVRIFAAAPVWLTPHGVDNTSQGGLATRSPDGLGDRLSPRAAGGAPVWTVRIIASLPAAVVPADRSKGRNRAPGRASSERGTFSADPLLRTAGLSPRRARQRARWQARRPLSRG